MRPKLGLVLMTNRKLHMRFRLASRSATLDDQLNCYKFEFSENFVGFRRFGRQHLFVSIIVNLMRFVIILIKFLCMYMYVATAKRMKDLYCQRQRCNPVNVLFNI